MTQHNIPEDLKLLQHRCEKLRSYKNTPNKRPEMVDISYLLGVYFPPPLPPILQLLRNGQCHTRILTLLCRYQYPLFGLHHLDSI